MWLDVDLINVMTLLMVNISVIVAFLTLVLISQRQLVSGLDIPATQLISLGLLSVSFSVSLSFLFLLRVSFTLISLILLM